MPRCSLCPGVHKVLPPDGPPSSTLFVGEAGGFNEERQGRVFVGKTGDEVNRHYLPLAGLRRENVMFTNAIACFPTSSGGKLDLKAAKDKALLESCATCHLYPLIERVQPKVIVAMGAFACAAVNPEIDLELDHGLPCESPWGIPVFPQFHPASGLHEPKRLLLLRNDWMRLKDYLAGKLRRKRDPFPEPDYQVATLLDTISIDPHRPLACDTEFSRRLGPYCLTYSQQPGTGRLILAENTEHLAQFQALLDVHQAPILFHSWLSDRPVVQDMGLRFPEHRIVDTLAWVFHLGNLPQGLKALAYRELGMVMQDFDDLVTPHSTQLVLRYFNEAYDMDWPKPDEQVVREKDGSFKLYKPQSLSTKLKRFYTDLRKDPNKDVFQSWDNWEEHHAEVEAECGEFPYKDVRHAPFDKMLHYACRDSDALLRLYPILVKMRQRVRKFPQEKWRGAA